MSNCLIDSSSCCVIESVSTYVDHCSNKFKNLSANDSCCLSDDEISIGNKVTNRS